MKIAVLGAGISGLGAAYLLSQKHEVDLYEKKNRLGGHARTTMVKEDTNSFGVDTGFLVFNHATYPLLTKLFKRLHVAIEASDMSFAFWDKQKHVAYSGESLGGMFFQKKNLLSLKHYRMIYDIVRFNKKANADLKSDGKDLDKSLGEYIDTFSEVFKSRYLIPMGASIWSTPSEKMHDFPARTFLQFFKNHGLLGVDTHHQWLTVKGGSINYVNKLADCISGKIVLNSPVVSIKRHTDGAKLFYEDGTVHAYDKVILAMHAPDALALLDDASKEEQEILGAFSYKDNQAYLHSDTSLLYPDKKVYAAWNYRHDGHGDDVTLTYWINRLQNLPTKKEYFVSLNEKAQVPNALEKIEYAHPQFDAKAIAMQKRRDEIDGKSNTYFAGAYWRYGFHEDGLWSANTIAKKLGCEL